MTGQNDRQNRRLTGQVCNQAGHCPLTGRYLQPWKVVSDGPGLMDFAIRLVNSVLDLPDGQVMFFEEFK